MRLSTNMFIPQLAILVYLLFAALTISQALPAYYAVNHARSIEARLESTEELESLQPRGLVGMVVDVVKEVLSLVEGAINSDKNARRHWTEMVVSKLKAWKSGYNWIICHVKEKHTFEGVEGKDWGSFHKTFHGKIGWFRYVIYWFRAGTFHRLGDGDWLNWAWIGSGKSSKNGSLVNFTAPPGPPGEPPTSACLKDKKDPCI